MPEFNEAALDVYLEAGDSVGRVLSLYDQAQSAVREGDNSGEIVTAYTEAVSSLAAMLGDAIEMGAPQESIEALIRDLPESLLEDLKTFSN